MRASARRPRHGMLRQRRLPRMQRPPAPRAGAVAAAAEAGVTRKSTHRGVIYCNGHAGGSQGWSFPLPVRRRLQRDLDGLSVLHLFGGRATFGTRIDIDPINRPDVIADAWLPPFGKNSFDSVVLDPPYESFGRHCRFRLGVTAAWIARRYVVWFSSFAATSLPGCRVEKWWTVIVNNDAYVRQLAFFVPTGDKLTPDVRFFDRGPARRYNRWISQPNSLPFEQAVSA